MNIRQAEEEDIPRLGKLLLQVCGGHYQGRPNLFRAEAGSMTIRGAGAAEGS